MISRVFLLLSAFPLKVFASYSFDPAAYDANDVLSTDVAIVGGGSAGVYSAVRLQDYNRSVIIIEKNDYLGGHAETYIDPQSGVPINLGVVVFPQTQTVKDYFARFDVPLTTLRFSFAQGPYIDFSTGKAVNYTYPAAADVTAALQGYAAQLEKYPSVQAGFNLIYPVSADLLLEYGIFLSKYNLSALIPTSFALNQGYSPLLNISTIYMLKNLNVNTLGSISNGSLVPASHNTGDLYDQARAHLGPSAYLNTSILAMNRSTFSNVRIIVQTNGTHKLILAKKLLSTAPPQNKSLAGYDLSTDETNLFNQLMSNGYYTGVLNNTGLNPNTRYTARSPSQPYNLPHLPGIYDIVPTGASRLMHVFYGSPRPMPVDSVKMDILASLKRLRAAQGLENGTSEQPNFVAFTDHAPFNLMVSTKAISAGFYSKLYALNGQRNTFYNGAAWQTQDSNEIWEYTDRYILPILLASL